jgi:di/tricarboxylate transporter
MGILLVCLAIILAVIFIGYKTKINIGLLALSAAYIFGAFFLKIKPADIVNMWPIKVFLLLFSVTFFYGFAALNGTLEKFSLKVVYASRKAPWSIPIVIFLLATLLAGVGAGDGATAMLIPIAFSVAKVTNMNYLLATVSVVSGISMGGFTPISTVGIFIRELAEQVGKHGQEAVNAYANRAMLQAFSLFTLVFIAAYIIFKGYKMTLPVMEKPAPFDRKQKVNLVIIACFVGILVIVPVLKDLFPKSAAIKLINGNLHLAFLAFTASVAATLFKLADEKKVFARVPWTAFVTLCGMGTLIGVISKSGAIEYLKAVMSGGISGSLVQVLLAICAGIMSLFVSGFVVNTTFFALIPALAVGLALNPGALYAAVAVGGMSTAVSPFSGSGGMVIACIDDEERRTKIFNALLVWPFINLVFYLVLILLGL